MDQIMGPPKPCVNATTLPLVTQHQTTRGFVARNTTDISRCSGVRTAVLFVENYLMKEITKIAQRSCLWRAETPRQIRKH